MTRKTAPDPDDAPDDPVDTVDEKPNTDPAPTEKNDDGEQVCSVCGLKGRPPGHH